MERGIMMLFHGIVIALALYLVMVFLLKQNCAVAENRSILMGAVIVIYMILFGHGLPGTLNKNI
jgi:hypothetical protein|uniref:Uncharacterized protein n=1 Tax=viral metagenome TaxID=1070528 RepID=A0A6C0BGC5_9ZZZZ